MSSEESSDCLFFGHEFVNSLRDNELLVGVDDVIDGKFGIEALDEFVVFELVGITVRNVRYDLSEPEVRGLSPAVADRREDVGDSVRVSHDL